VAATAPRDALLATRGRLTDDEADTLRILQRVPAWGRELVAGMLPPEAGLDRAAISYSKGCYLGQEVLSRIRSAGKLNRRLIALAVDPTLDPAALAGAKLVAQLPGGPVAAGDLTSVAPLPPPAGEWRAALGFRNRTCEDAGSFDLLLADGTTAAAAARVR
jgi:folate-binding protein YgfZ